MGLCCTGVRHRKVATRYAYVYDAKFILVNANFIHCELYILIYAHAYYNFGKLTVFNNKIYDQIKSGNFDQDQGEIREYHFTFRMGTLFEIKHDMTLNGLNCEIKHDITELLEL